MDYGQPTQPPEQPGDQGFFTSGPGTDTGETASNVQPGDNLNLSEPNWNVIPMERGQQNQQNMGRQAIDSMNQNLSYPNNINPQEGVNLNNEPSLTGDHPESLSRTDETNVSSNIVPFQAKNKKAQGKNSEVLDKNVIDEMGELIKKVNNNEMELSDFYDSARDRAAGYQNEQFGRNTDHLRSSTEGKQTA